MTLDEYAKWKKSIATANVIGSEFTVEQLEEAIEFMILNSRQSGNTLHLATIEVERLIMKNRAKDVASIPSDKIVDSPLNDTTQNSIPLNRFVSKHRNSKKK